MMNKIIILFFCLICLFANDFKEFDEKFFSLNKNEQLALHQKMKAAYIKSIISDNKEDKIQALKRIIISSKKLSLSYAGYEKELNQLGVKDISINTLKDSVKIKKEDKEKQNTASTQNKIIKNASNINNENKAKVVKKQEKTQESIKQKTYISSVLKYQNKEKIGVMLKTNSKLEEEIKESKFKNMDIFNFTAVLDTKKSSFKLDECDVSVSQFNPSTARVVFTNAKEKINYEVNNNSIIFYYIKNTKTSTSTQASNVVKTKQVKSKESISKQVKLNKISPTSDYILLTFSDELTDISNKANYIDIKASSAFKKNTFNVSNNKISIYNLNKDTIRIINNSKQNLDYELSENTMKIYVKNNDLFKKNFLIAIDAGHGGKDSGASANKLLEKNITLAIAKQLARELSNNGYRVFLTRSNDTYIGLRQRTKLANDKKSDLFISIHANSLADKSKYNSVYGIETYFLSPARSERSKNAAAIENKSDVEEMNYFSKQTFLNFLNREKIISSNKLAIDIQGGILSAIPKSYKAKDGGVKEAPFWVLVGALMPAVLIEVGYITHPVEGKNIANPRYQQYIIKGIVNGINNYFEKNKF